MNEVNSLNKVKPRKRSREPSIVLIPALMTKINLRERNIFPNSCPKEQAIRLGGLNSSFNIVFFLKKKKKHLKHQE